MLLVDKPPDTVQDNVLANKIVLAKVMRLKIVKLQIVSGNGLIGLIGQLVLQIVDKPPDTVQDNA